MNRQTLALLGILTLCFLTTGRAMAQNSSTVRYEGVWRIQPNGDTVVTRTFTLPMRLYEMWKGSNRHLAELRNMNSERTPFMVSDKSAKWDDGERKLIITATIQGMTRNLGGRWEARVTHGETFSNLDESKRTAYFFFHGETPMAKVQGTDKIIMPEGSEAPVWDEASRTLAYDLAEENPGYGAGMAPGVTVIQAQAPNPYWLPAGILGGVALATLLTSLFLRAPKRAKRPQSGDTEMFPAHAPAAPSH